MIYVVDAGNNRVQQLSPEGKPLAQWGSGGTAPLGSSGCLVRTLGLRSTPPAPSTSQMGATTASNSL